MISRKRPLGMQMIILLLMVATIGTPVLANDYDAWLRKAELGPYQPVVEDWDAIYEAAKSEPPLVAYVATSRALDAAADMMREYPGVEVETLFIGAAEILERVRREWNAGLRDVGLLFAPYPEVHHESLLPRDIVTRYVPRELELVMKPSDTQPLLRQRFSTYVWAFNGENFDSAPWDNVWELTTERFRNRVVITDPFEDQVSMTWLAAIVINSSQMEELYGEFFGTPYTGKRNAGLEFMKRLLENDVRIVNDSREVGRAISASTGPFAGLTGYSRYKDVLDGQETFAIDTKNAPAAGSFWYLSVGSFNKSPNTAKLFTRWLMSQEGGKYWWGPNFPSNPEVKMPEPWELELKDFELVWSPTPEEFAEVRDDILDSWLLWR